MAHVKSTFLILYMLLFTFLSIFVAGFIPEESLLAFQNSGWSLLIMFGAFFLFYFLGSILPCCFEGNMFFAVISDVFLSPLACVSFFFWVLNMSKVTVLTVQNCFSMYTLFMFVMLKEIS